MIVGNGKMLAAVDRSRITKLFWPTVNNFQNMADSRIGVFSFNENKVSWIDEWKIRQEYMEDSNILETVAKKDRLEISVKDFVLPMGDCIVRIISANEPCMVYYYTRTQLGETQKKDSVTFEGCMFHKNREMVLCVSSNADVREHDVGNGMDFDSLQEKNSGEGSSIMSFFTRPNKESGTHDIAVFIALANSKKDANRLMTGVMNTDADKWLYKTQFYWQKWLEKSEIKDAKASRALLNMKMLMDRSHGGFASSAELRYSLIREGVYAAYAFDLAGYHDESSKFYSWLKNAITKHKYLLFADGTPISNNEKRTDQVATAIWGIYSHYLETNDKKFLVGMWDSVVYAAEELKKNFNPKTGLLSPSMTPWEDGFDVNAYTAASSYSAFRSAAAIAHKIGRDETADEWESISQKIKDSYLYMCSGETYHRAYKDKGVDSHILSMVAPFNMIEPWDEKLEKTMEKMEMELWDNGLKRNSSSDKACSISTAWLAWFHKKSGNMKKYRIVMDSLNEKFTPLGVPSFVSKDKNDVALWPHAMYLIARMD